MGHRRDHIDFEPRQRATPHDVLRNDALFEGILIKGGRPLRRLQRMGTVVIGLFLLIMPLFLIAVLVRSVLQGESAFDSSDGRIVMLIVSVVALIVEAGFIYCGVRMLKNAFTAPTARKD